MKLSDVQIQDGSKYPHLSLAKLCGKTIADIECSITTEFGQPNIKLYRVVFTDGTKLYVEGEHDLPYVTDATEPVLPTEGTLYDLYHEENK